MRAWIELIARVYEPAISLIVYLVLFIEFAFPRLSPRAIFLGKKKYYWWISVFDKTRRIATRFGRSARTYSRLSSRRIVFYSVGLHTFIIVNVIVPVVERRVAALDFASAIAMERNQRVVLASIRPITRRLLYSIMKQSKLFILGSH